MTDVWEAPDRSQWESGETFASDLPILRKSLVEQVKERWVIPVVDDNDRGNIFGSNPGSSKSYRCRYPDLHEEQWDGKQWLKYDMQPRVMTFAGNLYWYSEVSSSGSKTGMDIGNGAATGWYKYDGHWVDWNVTIIRGSTTWLGSDTGFYSWQLPFPARQTVIGTNYAYDQGGTSASVNLGGKLVSLGVAWRTASNVCLTDNDGNRLGTNTFAWDTGHSISFGGRTRLGGLA